MIEYYFLPKLEIC